MDPDNWEPGIPLYEPYSGDYGYSRCRPLFGVITDHPEECILPWDGEDECIYGGKGWRWYPRKPAVYPRTLGGDVVPGPPVTEFHGARIGPTTKKAPQIVRGGHGLPQTEPP